MKTFYYQACPPAVCENANPQSQAYIQCGCGGSEPPAAPISNWIGFGILIALIIGFYIHDKK